MSATKFHTHTEQRAKKKSKSDGFILQFVLDGGKNYDLAFGAASSKYQWHLV